MARLNILRYPDARLHKFAAPVTVFDESLRGLVADMAETMYAAPGIGLAAIQVDVPKQVIVVDVSERRDSLIVLVNPEIEWRGEEVETMEEGCLSLPGVGVEVERPVRVRVRAQDETGASLVVEATGLEARVIQHEVDHLDGVLILDRTSRDQRKQAMRAMREVMAGHPPPEHEISA